jgi:predicted RNase H-like HicB family nuclease
MMEYALYLESGPRRRTTMVHVLDLLGCISQGSTTEAALEATPEAIRAYLRFLQRHGEAAQSEAAFTTVVAQHVSEGSWLGYGDPAPGFAPDLQPLSAEDLAVHLRRLHWLQSDLLQIVSHLPAERLLAAPLDRGRSIYAILQHVCESQCTYLRMAVGKVEGLADALRVMQQSPETLPSALPQLWQIADSRLRAMTEAERKQLVPHGQVTWSAHRALRRTLEHGWEHLLEISRRLDSAPG